MESHTELVFLEELSIGKKSSDNKHVVMSRNSPPTKMYNFLFTASLVVTSKYLGCRVDIGLFNVRVGTA